MEDEKEHGNCIRAVKSSRRIKEMRAGLEAKGHRGVHMELNGQHVGGLEDLGSSECSARNRSLAVRIWLDVEGVSVCDKRPAQSATQTEMSCSMQDL